MKEEAKARLTLVLEIIDTFPRSEWKKLVDKTLARDGTELRKELSYAMPPGQKPPGFDEFMEQYVEFKEILQTIAHTGKIDVYSRGFWRNLASDNHASKLAIFGMNAYGRLVAENLMSEIIQLVKDRPESEAERWNDAAYELHGVDWDAAIKQHDRAIAAEHDYPLAWINKGIALKNQRRYEEAIKCYDEAKSIDPEHKKAWFNKGNALSERAGTTMNAEDIQAAVQCYEMALQINPEYQLAVNALIRCRLALESGIFT